MASRRVWRAMRLFSYKLTHDSGFAPNPFHGICTLATCKPRIRECKAVGDWIAGFSSAKLNGDAVGDERLIYLFQVDEKLPLESYHSSPRFAAKIPKTASLRCVDRAGDNIYGKRNGAFFQVPNRHHAIDALPKDTGGKYVLIGTRFYYFGSEPLIIPRTFRPNLPQGQSSHGARTHEIARVRAFIDFVQTQGLGIHARPTIWESADRAWQDA